MKTVTIDVETLKEIVRSGWIIPCVDVLTSTEASYQGRPFTENDRESLSDCCGCLKIHEGDMLICNECGTVFAYIK